MTGNVWEEETSSWRLVATFGLALPRTCTARILPAERSAPSFASTRRIALISLTPLFMVRKY